MSRVKQEDAMKNDVKQVNKRKYFAEDWLSNLFLIYGFHLMNKKVREHMVWLFWMVPPSKANPSFSELASFFFSFL